MGSYELGAFGADGHLDGYDSLIPETPKPTPPRLPALLVGSLLAVLVFGLGAWWLWFDRRAPRSTTEPETLGEGPNGSVTSSAARPTRPSQASLPQVSPLVEDVPTPIMGPGPDDHPDGPAHPHPITPRHQKIFHENALIGALNDAMDLQDAAKMRQLIREHAETHPEDENGVREGYTLVAECLEHPGPAATAAGQRYFDRERGSTLRRMIQRYCLLPRN